MCRQWRKFFSSALQRELPMLVQRIRCGSVECTGCWILRRPTCVVLPQQLRRARLPVGGAAPWRSEKFLEANGFCNWVLHVLVCFFFLFPGVMCNRGCTDCAILMKTPPFRKKKKHSVLLPLTAARGLLRHCVASTYAALVVDAGTQLQNKAC